ncbi:MAG: phosphotransferase [Patescibacteria group bacterium]
MLDDILDSFSISRPVSVRQISTGLVNQTFKIINSDGIFALQSLHTIFPDETLGDMYTVTNFLIQQGLRVPKLIKTTSGDFFMRDHNNLRWRLYSWIDGWVHEAVADEAMAEEAGRLVGSLHQALQGLAYQPQGSLPHFHDTPYVLSQLTELQGRLPDEAKYLAHNILIEAPKTILDSADLPTHVIHGDLKITNLLFNENQKAIGIIDFDTLIWKPRAIDVGDALRSWCNRTAEDDPEAVFDNAIFQAAEKGYSQGFSAQTDNPEHHKQVAKQIAYELSARFLIDVVNDNYFRFDDKRYPTRTAHNLARALGQYHLAKSIQM